MGLFDRLLKRGDFSEVVSVPADHYLKTFPSDQLLAVAGASTSLEAAGIVSTGMAAIVLSTGEMVDEVVATDEIEPLVRSLLRAAQGEERVHLRASWMGDNYWLALGPAGVDELAEVTNEACLEILARRYRQLLGPVVFAYRESEGAERSVFLIFHSWAGVWCPFAPVPDSDDADNPDRDFEFEHQLEVKLADALPVAPYPGDRFQFREAPF